jgi:hemolysin D
VFPVTLTPERTVMSVDGQQIPLTPARRWMSKSPPATAASFEYLFSPLVETASQATSDDPQQGRPSLNSGLLACHD